MNVYKNFNIWLFLLFVDKPYYCIMNKLNKRKVKMLNKA